jgi:hypothetical protein
MPQLLQPFHTDPSSLDDATARVRSGGPANGATDSQVGYVRSLAAKRATHRLASGPGSPAEILSAFQNGRVISKSQASRLIDALKRAPLLDEPKSIRLGVGPVAAKVPARETVPEGFYYVADPEGDYVAKVQLNLAGTRKYAKRLCVYLDGSSWEYTPGLVEKLTPEMALTEEQATRMGTDPNSPLYGWCCICGLRLTNELSIELGIGPICRGKMGW